MYQGLSLISLTLGTAPNHKPNPNHEPNRRLLMSLTGTVPEWEALFIDLAACQDLEVTCRSLTYRVRVRVRVGVGVRVRSLHLYE